MEKIKIKNRYLRPVHLSIDISPPSHPLPPKLYLPFTSWNIFHDLVDQNIDLVVSLITNREIDDADHQLTNVIQAAPEVSQ